MRSFVAQQTYFACQFICIPQLCKNRLCQQPTAASAECNVNQDKCSCLVVSFFSFFFAKCTLHVALLSTCHLAPPTKHIHLSHSFRMPHTFHYHLALCAGCFAWFSLHFKYENLFIIHSLYRQIVLYCCWFVVINSVFVLVATFFAPVSLALRSAVFVCRQIDIRMHFLALR